MSLNKVMLIGNVGRDPEVRHLENGSVSAAFTLATSERYRDRNGESREQTEWHSIVCWKQLAEFAERYIRKGSQLYIEGRIRYRTYTDPHGNVRHTTEITADTVQLLGKRPEAAGTPRTERIRTERNAPEQPAGPAPAGSPDETDDLPF